MENIGGKIKDAMDSKGLTAYKLHVATGVSQSTIGRIVKNIGEPNSSTLKILCDYLGVEHESNISNDTDDDGDVIKDLLQHQAVAYVVKYHAQLMKLDTKYRDHIEKIQLQAGVEALTEAIRRSNLRLH